MTFDEALKMDGEKGLGPYYFAADPIILGASMSMARVEAVRHRLVNITG